MTVNGHATTYAYDVAGNLVSTTDPDGRTTAYTVNAQDLRTRIDYTQAGHASITVSQAFDPAGRRTAMTDPTTGTHTFAYDASGNLVTAANGVNNTFSYDYSVPGKMTETYPDGSTVTYSYDDGHDVMGVSTTGAQVSYLRNAARRVTGLTYSNGVVQTQDYNQAGQVDALSLSCGGTTELAMARSFDAAGAPLGQATTVGTQTTVTSFGYDDTARVSAQSTTSSLAAHPTTPNPSPACTSGSPASQGSPNGNDNSGTTSDFTAPTTANPLATPDAGDPGTGTHANPIAYDAVGNQLSVNGTTISYNAGDEVTSESGANPAAYTYDLNGDVTEHDDRRASPRRTPTTPPTSSSTVTRGATTINYGYDGDGNRVTRVVTGPDSFDGQPLLGPEQQASAARPRARRRQRAPRPDHLRRRAGRDADARRHVLPAHRRPGRRHRAQRRHRRRARDRTSTTPSAT